MNNIFSLSIAHLVGTEMADLGAVSIVKITVLAIWLVLSFVNCICTVAHVHDETVATCAGAIVPTGLELDWLEMPITEDGMSCLLSNDDFQVTLLANRDACAA